MLAHRTMLAITETFSIFAIASCGLPQGGGLSPILWSLVADSLLKWLSKQGVFAQGFEMMVWSSSVAVFSALYVV